MVLEFNLKKYLILPEPHIASPGLKFDQIDRKGHDKRKSIEEKTQSFKFQSRQNREMKLCIVKRKG